MRREAAAPDRCLSGKQCKPEQKCSMRRGQCAIAHCNALESDADFPYLTPTTGDGARDFVKRTGLRPYIALPLVELIFPNLTSGITFFENIQGGFLTGVKSGSFGQKHNERNYQHDRNQPHQNHGKTTAKHSRTMHPCTIARTIHCHSFNGNYCAQPTSDINSSSHGGSRNLL